ncbi:MAG TPA: hypothetical protein VEW65_12175 [Chryseolinea sp.]|nr:hypothetical protein [Chryseolinea sp.]
MKGFLGMFDWDAGLSIKDQFKSVIRTFRRYKKDPGIIYFPIQERVKLKVQFWLKIPVMYYHDALFSVLLVPTVGRDYLFKR